MTEPFDPTALSPAPWQVEQDALGHWRILWSHSVRSSVAKGGKVFDEHDAAFIALSRNAYDVMARRGWGVERIGQQWYLAEHGFPQGMGHLKGFDCPFALLVAADKWVRENMEGKVS